MAIESHTKRSLRAAAHALKPVLTVGERGITEGLLAELDTTLETHELIKVRLPALAREARAELGSSLLAASGATLIQSIGRTLVLYRQRRAQPAATAASGTRERRRITPKRPGRGKASTPARRGSRVGFRRS